MTELGLLVLPITLAVAIAAAIVIVLRRSGVIAAASREASGGRRTVAELAARADALVLPIADRIDQLRRGQLAAAALEDELETIGVSVGALAEEATSLAVPRGLVEMRDGIAAELGRAQRALDMVEHGRSILASARARGRELEAQTAIKRGYLNLIHAREAIVSHAAAAAAWRSSAEVRRDARRPV